MILPLMMAVITAAAAPAGPPAVGQATPRPAAAAPKPLAKPAIEPKSETGCGYVVAVEKKPAKKGDKPTYDISYKEVAGLKVLGGPEKLDLPKTTDKVAAIRCIRDTVIPGDGDGRVFLETGRELSLSDGARLAVLGVGQAKGKPPAVQFAMRQGKLTEEEKTALNARLAILQRNLNGIIAARRAAAAKKAAADAPVSTKQQ